MRYDITTKDGEVFITSEDKSVKIGDYTADNCYFSICNGQYWQAFDDGKVEDNAQIFASNYLDHIKRLFED